MANGSDLAARFQKRERTAEQWAMSLTRDLLGDEGVTVAGMEMVGPCSRTASKIEWCETFNRKYSPRPSSARTMYGFKIRLMPPFTKNGEVVVPTLGSRSGSTGRIFTVYPSEVAGPLMKDVAYMRLLQFPALPGLHLQEFLADAASEYLMQALCRQRIKIRVVRSLHGLDFTAPAVDPRMEWSVKLCQSEMDAAIQEIVHIHKASEATRAIIDLFRGD